jgi:hypothetical protein
MTSSRIARLGLVISLMTMFACGGPNVAVRGDTMTPAEISEHGSHVYHAPLADVVRAGVAALSSIGYEIASADAERGLVVTRPKLVHSSTTSAAAVGGGQARGIAVTRDYYRRYKLIMREQDGATTVAAEPSMFEGSQDISSMPIWALAGGAGERTLWDQLFKEMDTHLTPKAKTPAASPAPGAGTL